MPPPAIAGAAPVRFSDAAADALIAALDALASALDAAVRADHQVVPAATVDWAGATRTWLDRAHADALEPARRAASHAHRAAAEVRAAKVAATALQHDRNAEALRTAAVDLARLEARVRHG